MSVTLPKPDFYLPFLNVSLTTTGNKVTVDIPTNRTLIILSIPCRIRTVSNFSGAPSLRIGVTPNFNEFLSETSLTNFDLDNTTIDLTRLGGVSKYCFNGDQNLVVDCTVASQSSILNVDIFIIGFLI